MKKCCYCKHLGLYLIASEYYCQLCGRHQKSSIEEDGSITQEEDIKKEIHTILPSLVVDVVQKDEKKKKKFTNIYNRTNNIYRNRRS